jgi:hypothetical protein
MPKFLIAIIVLAIAAGGGYWYWTTTPQYSLLEVRNAFKSHDVQAFNKYVDVDAISGDIVDVVVEKPTGIISEFGPVGKLFSFGLVSFIKPQIAESVKRQLNQLVADGGVKSMADREQKTQLVSDEPRKKISLKNFIRDLGFTGKIYHGIAYVRSEGKASRAGINLFNEKYNRDFVLELRMADMGGYWQINQLSNLREFVGSIFKLETKGPEAQAFPCAAGKNNA